MVPAPTFTRPHPAWFAVLDGGVAALTVLSASPTAHEAVAEQVPLPSRKALQGLLAVTVALHVGEALYCARLARRHGLPAGRWARQTLAVGFPSTLALRRLTRQG